MKRLVTLLFLLATLASFAQNQIDTRKLTVRDWIIYQGDTLAVWEDSLGNVYNRNTGDLILSGQVFVPDIEAAGAKYDGYVAGIGIDDRLFPKSIVDLFNEQQDTLAKMSTPSPYAMWTRDSTKAAIYQVQLTDKVGIGLNSPNKMLDVAGDVEIVADVTSSTGFGAALRLQTNAYGDAAGLQWGGLYSTMFTVAGETEVDQLNGVLTNLTHSHGFRLPLYEGFESGEGAISGAGTIVTNFYAYEVKLPQVTDGAVVDTACGIHIGGSSTTGITNPYAIYSMAAAPSYIRGPVAVDNTLSCTGFTASNFANVTGTITAGGRVISGNELWVGDTTDHVANSTLVLHDYGGRNFALTSGYSTNGQFEIFRMLNNMTKSTVYFTITSGGLVGINTTAPDKMLEINAATGGNLRLTYNDNNGSATNYADFATTSGGDLTITPSGKDVSVVGAFKSATGAVADGDTTPDVSGYNTFIYAGSATASTTVTDLDNPVVGAYYTFIGNSDSYVLVFGGGNFKMTGSSPSLGVDDNITFYCLADNYYIEISRANNNP